MLGRRRRRRVLAEIPAPRPASYRPGALDGDRLTAFSRLMSVLTGSRVVLATGPAKSEVALGLATAATAKGARVALLEADLAAPALAAVLGLSPSPGLHEFLLGEARAPQILQALVLAGPASGPAVEPLTCIVAGGSGPASEPLLASERCRHAIGRLRAAYELLVIDGPGLDRGPDAVRELAGLVDTTIVCGGRAEVPRRLPASVAGLVVCD
jgi:Mrp family chromosome partitioning ATPase